MRWKGCCEPLFRLSESASSSLMRVASINDVRGNKPKLSADDVRQILAFGASVFLDASGGGAAGAAAGRVWDAAAVDALIDKSVAEAAAETARKFAAAAAGQDYGGGVDGVFAGLRRWTLDATDADLAAAEAAWRARYERIQQEGVLRDQAVRLGKGCRVRQPVLPQAPAPSAAGGAGFDVDSEVVDDDSDAEASDAGSDASASVSGDSLEEDDDFVTTDAPPLRPRAAPFRAPLVAAAPPGLPAAAPPPSAHPGILLKWEFERARVRARLDYAGAAAAAGVKFVALCAWLSPEHHRELPVACRVAVERWIAGVPPPTAAAQAGGGTS